MSKDKPYCKYCEYYAITPMDKHTKLCSKRMVYTAKKNFCEDFMPKKLCFDCKDKGTCSVLCDAAEKEIGKMNAGDISKKMWRRKRVNIDLLSDEEIEMHKE